MEAKPLETIPEETTTPTTNKNELLPMFQKRSQEQPKTLAVLLLVKD